MDYVPKSGLSDGLLGVQMPTLCRLLIEKFSIPGACR